MKCKLHLSKQEAPAASCSHMHGHVFGSLHQCCRIAVHLLHSGRGFLLVLNWPTFHVDVAHILCQLIPQSLPALGLVGL